MEIILITKKIILIFMLLISLNSIGQVNKLTPCVNFSNEIGEIKEYNKELEQIFKRYFKDNYIFRFVAKPSVESEYAFQIYEIDSSVFEIVTITLTENLWNTKKVDTIYFHRKNINSELVSEIDTLFKRLTDSISLKNARGYGEDGIKYIFKYKHKGYIRCGETWSPPNKSLLCEVIRICDNLVLYSHGEELDLNELQKHIKLINERVR